MGSGMRNIGKLTNREMECLCWASKGKTAYETAIILGISYETARWYRKQVREKLDCATLTQAISEAHIRGRGTFWRRRWKLP
jgi:DNA-binding CsgD family transcriptional regulator